MPVHVRHIHITGHFGSARALKRDVVLTALVDLFVVISTVVAFHHMATTGTLTLARAGIQIVSLLILGYGQFQYWKFQYWKSTYTALLGRRGSGEPSVSPQVARRALRRELSLVALLLGGVIFFGALDVADEVQARHVEWLWLWLVAIAVLLLLLYGLVRLIVMLPSLRFPQDSETSGDLTAHTSAGDDAHSRAEEHEREGESSDD